MVVNRHICAISLKNGLTCIIVTLVIVNYFNIPKCRTSLAQRSYRYRATKIWNNIPDKIRNSQTITILKGKSRTVYIPNLNNLNSS